MSDLREQLEKARQAYQRASYRGDLAMDVLARNGRLILNRRMAAATAVAAGFLLAFGLWQSDGSKQQARTAPVVTTQASSGVEIAMATESPRLTEITVPAVSEITQSTMAPSFGSMVISEVPAISDVNQTNTQTSTTRETNL